MAGLRACACGGQRPVTGGARACLEPCVPAAAPPAADLPPPPLSLSSIVASCVGEVDLFGVSTVLVGQTCGGVSAVVGVDGRGCTVAGGGPAAS